MLQITGRRKEHICQDEQEHILRTIAHISINQRLKDSSESSKIPAFLAKVEQLLTFRLTYSYFNRKLRLTVVIGFSR